MSNARRSKKTSKLIIFFLIVFIIMFIISAYKIIEWQLNNMQNEQILQEIKGVVEESNEENTYNIDFKTLKQKNADTVAWVKVNGTSVEYPVVQTSNNSYYLKRNFNKEYNVAGWIFADYRNKLDGTDKNTIIYGHSVKDGSMFGTLKNILKEEWYNNEQNHIINFITETKQQKYQVFSVYEIETEDYYIKTDFAGNEFLEFIETLKSRSIKDFDVEVTGKDNILTLSTCGDTNKYRIVLHAKEVM